jgi:hypothetical protein
VAAAPATDSEYGARYLASQIDASTGLFVTRFGQVPRPRPEYGVAIDAVISLAAVGTEPAAVDTLLGALEPAVENIVRPTGGYLAAGNLGRLVVAVDAAGDDPRDFGGRDLVAELVASIGASGRPEGNATNDGAAGQARIVRALIAADESAVALTATDALIEECSWNSGNPGPCGDVRTTADAVIALSASLDDVAYSETAAAAVESGVEYLLATQAPDGSYSNSATDDASISSIAAQALAAGGAPEARVARSAGYVRQLQYDAATAKGALADARGAVTENYSMFEGSKLMGVSSSSSIGRASAIYTTAVALPTIAMLDDTLEFTDVPSVLGFFPEITWLSGTGITRGYQEADGSFTYRPSASVLREQMAAFLYRFAGSPEWESPAVSPFSDVSTTHVFYREITWLANEGITTGYENSDGSTSFRPSQPVLREQMAAFLYRAAGADRVDDDGATFADVAPTHVFYDDIEWLASAGVTTGYPTADGGRVFRGADPVLREQMAAFLFRFSALDL